jgi:glyoxylase-like metal-dependent hydrolase (beta-lactamase superfamily II)
VRAVDRLAPEHFPEGLSTVAVFGPGQGEAIFVALPDGRVGVLDGCAENADPVAALIEKLDQERGDRRRFAFVGLTHPHDDHYRGLGRLLETYRDRIDQWWEPPLGERSAEVLLALGDAQKKDRKAYARSTDLDSLPRVLRAMEQAASSGKAYCTPVKDLPLTLDASGEIVQVVLAGDADFYGP